MDPAETLRPGGDPALVIPMNNYDTYIHGGLDPGQDENVPLIPAVEVKEAERDFSKNGNDLFSSSENGESSGTSMLSYPSTDSFVPATPDRSFLLDLPTELFDYILSFLGPIELATISSTCRVLSVHAKSDLAWYRHVQENVPGVRLTSPFPCNTYRELYISHDPHWFISKYKIFFCDHSLTGKVIIVRYDPRRGCMEGYRLVAERPPPTFAPWEADDEVIVHSFTPESHLHLDQPVLHIDALPLASLNASSGSSRPVHRFNAETSMRIDQRHSHGIFSNFLLARPVQEHRNMSLWPPPLIPARQRVRNASQEAFTGSGHKPQKRSEISTQTFRIRRWLEMRGQGPGLHLGEEVSTYATLDPKLYTPTEEKPYRGIWVGDYSGHGCEFLLINQPDNHEPFDEGSVVQKEDETTEEWETRKREERIYRGRLEAIKLTGDANIPRGQYTFIADDISNKGFVRNATEARFKGARIVQSRGHIAERGFRGDKYIKSQLILISPNRVGQYWVDFGHISFYERVDIDKFLSPFNDPPPKYPA